MLAVTLGVLIIRPTFPGFSGGSRLALGGAADAVAVSNILVNASFAAAAGLLAAFVLSLPVFGKVDLPVSLHGAIGGLAATVARPDIADHRWATVVDAVGSIIAMVVFRPLGRLRIDDEVCAISVHTGTGIPETMAVCVTAGGDPFVRFVGAAFIGAFVFGASLSIWLLIDPTLAPVWIPGSGGWARTPPNSAQSPFPGSF